MNGTYEVLAVYINPLRVVLRRAQEGLPVTAILTVGGKLVPGQLSIDDTTGTAKVLFVDDKGDTDAPAPEGAVITFASDNPAIATIDANTGLVTPVAEGITNISANITDANGAPIMEPDGTTPFSVPPAPVQIGPGAAAGAELVIQGP